MSYLKGLREKPHQFGLLLIALGLTGVGGSKIDGSNGIAVGAEGNAYLTGPASSLNFPTANPWQSNYGGQSDAFIAKIASRQPVLISFSAATYTGAENAGSITIAVNLSAASEQTVTVDYATSEGTATAGSDYTATSGTLTFQPGETSQTFAVPILNDALAESDETVNLALSNPTNATLGTPSQAVLTIEDDDAVLVDETMSTVEVSPDTVTADGISTATVTITLRDAEGNPIPNFSAVAIVVSGTNNIVNQPPPTNDNGQTTATLASTRAETKTIFTLAVDAEGPKQLAAQPTVTFLPGPPAVLTLEAATPQAPIGSRVTITAAVTDAQANPLSDQEVGFEVTAGTGTVSPSTALTDAQGRAQTTLTLGEGTNTVQATAEALTQSVSVEGVQVVVDVNLSAVSLNPSEVAADGVSVTTITITLLTADSQPVPGVTEIVVSASGTNNTLTQPRTPTDEYGRTTATLASTTPETKTITVQVTDSEGTKTLTSQPTVTFLPAGNMLLQVQAEATTAIVGTQVAITATVTDLDGNPLPGQTVQFSVTAGEGSVSPPSATTNAFGQATTALSVAPGTNTVEATINSLRESVSVQGREVVVDVDRSSVTVDPPALLADGTATTSITITLREADGDPIEGLSAILVSASGTGNTLTQPTQPTDENGQTAATLASTKAEVKAITVEVTDSQATKTLTSQPTVIFTAGPPAHLSISSDLTSALVGGSVTITATVTDAYNNPLTGLPLNFAVVSGTGTVSPSSVPTAADGQAQTTLTPGAGENVVEVSFGTLQDRVTVTGLEALVDLARSSVAVSPGTLPADGQAQALVTITLRDQNGTPLPGLTGIVVQVSGSNNTVFQPTQPTNAQGQTTAIIASTRAEEKTITVEVTDAEGQKTLEAQPTVTFTAGEPATLSFTTGVVEANVGTSVTLLAQVMDAVGNPIASLPVQFTLRVGEGQLSTASATTGADGRASTTLTLGLGENTVQATVGDLQQTVTVQGRLGLVDPGQSTVTVSPSTVTANGTSVAVISVTLRDAGGAPVPLIVVTVSATGSNNIFTQPTAPTDEQGVAKATLASTTAQVKTLTVQVVDREGTKELVMHPTVTFAPGDPQNITLVSEQTVVSTAGSAILTATLTDLYGNPTPEMSVSFRVVSGGATVSPPSAVTDANGQAQAVVSQPSLGTNLVTARFGSLSATVTIQGEKSVTFPAGLQLISIPYDLGGMTAADLFGPQAPLAHWQPTEDGLGGTYLFDPRQIVLYPGYGYWTQFSTPPTVLLQTGSSPDPDRTFTVSLPKGWALLGNPFLDRTVTWSLERLRVQKGIESARTLREDQNRLLARFAWGWDGTQYFLVGDPTLPGFENVVGHLEPGRSYWVKVKDSSVRIILTADRQPAVRAPSRPSACGGPAPPPTPEAWQLTLTVEAGPARDGDNRLGVVPAASDLLIENPPPAAAGPFVDLSFAPDSRAPALWAVDLRSRPITRRTVWHLVVRTDVADAEVVLRWPHLNRSVPTCYRLTLVDEATGERRSLRTTAFYAFRAQRCGLTERRFRLEVEPRTSLGLQVLHFTAQPTRGRAVRLTFALSEPATVQARVLTPGGRVLRTLATTGAPDGVNTLTWDGCTDQGLPAPAGVYVVELVATSPTGEQTKALRVVRRVP